VRELQVRRRCRQELQQRGEVVGFKRHQQSAAPIADEGHARIAQRALVVGQMGALTHEDQHIGPARRARGDPALLVGRVDAQLPDPAGKLVRDRAAFPVVRVVVALRARFGQHVAQRRSRVGRLRRNGERQQHEGARRCRAGVLRLVQRVARQRGVEHIDDRLCVAPRDIRPQMHCCEIAPQQVTRRREQARLGAPETIDRLLRVADDEDGRPPVKCGLAIFRRTVAAEPGEQDLPLQRVGVLELVDQDVPVARVEPALQVGRMIGIGQQPVRVPLEIGEVERLLLRLEPLIAVDQQAAAAQRRLVDAQRLVGRSRVDQLQQAPGR
jgi:hypothetical protein